MYNLDFLFQFSLMGTTSRAVPNKLYAISTKLSYIAYNYIAMPTWSLYTYFILTSINLIRSKLSCIYFNVLTSISSCFVHAQPRIAGAGHPCYDRSLFHLCVIMFSMFYVYTLP